MAFVVQATVHLIAEVHYPHFSSESDHHTPPNQAPRAQDWCQAVRKDLQGPCLFAQNDLMAWAGKHFMPCSVHLDQLDTYKCKIRERKIYLSRLLCVSLAT